MGRIRIESKTKDNRDTELVDELVKVWESSVRTATIFCRNKTFGTSRRK